MKHTRNEEAALRSGFKILPDGSISSPFHGIIKGWVNRDGYRHFTLVGCGKRIKVPVARLQALIKFGPDALYQDGIQVRHLNGNPGDNSYGNIAIGTASDNNMDKPLETRRRVASMANKKYDHDAIVKAYNDGMSYKAIMLAFGISSKGTVSFIIRSSMATTSQPVSPPSP